MLKVKNYIYIALFFSLFISNITVAQKPSTTAKDVIFKMVKSITDLERLKYSLKIIERGKKGFNHYESSVKLNRKPRKIYLYIMGTRVEW